MELHPTAGKVALQWGWVMVLLMTPTDGQLAASLFIAGPVASTHLRCSARE
jgi:hypothetical protein